MCPALEDDASLSPDQRLRDVAAILAHGLRRLGHGAALSPDNDALSRDSATGLEDCAPSGPDGSGRPNETTQEV